ncbi:MAG: hypothetical protein Q9222_001844 [Ikaeria aurantiellina]
MSSALTRPSTSLPASPPLLQTLHRRDIGNIVALDISVQVVPKYSSLCPLPPADLTRLFFLEILTVYRTAAIGNKDSLIPKSVWRKTWDNIQIAILPDPDQDMRYGDAFFALGWIWELMAVPVSAFSGPDRGFKERSYIVGRREGRGEMVIKGLILSDATAINSTTTVNVSSPTDSTDSAVASELAFPDNSTISSAPYPNPFPVPESALVLFFGPRRVVLPGAPLKVIIYLLLTLIQRAWAVMLAAQHPGPTAFPAASITDPEYGLQVRVEPAPGQQGSGCRMTTDIVVEAAWGVVYYMLHEGVFGGHVSILEPDETGARKFCGDFYISHGSRTE